MQGANYLQLYLQQQKKLLNKLQTGNSAINWLKKAKKTPGNKLEGNARIVGLMAAVMQCFKGHDEKLLSVTMS
jgi:hypothetical protein